MIAVRNLPRLQPLLGNSLLSVLVLVLGLLNQGVRITFAADLPALEKLFKAGEYAQCAEGCAAAITAKEPSERYRLLQIQSELELGRYTAAARTFDDAIKSFPQSIELRWLGRDVMRFNDQPKRASVFDDEILQLLQQAPGRYNEPSSRIVLGKLLLMQGLEPKRVLEGTYNAIKKQQPGFAGVWLATGELALDKADYALAAENFERGIKLDPTDPQMYYGLARAFAPSDSKKAEQALQDALKLNPNHIPSLLLAADEQIDSEQYVEAAQLLDQIATINSHEPRALAYRAVLAHLRNEPDQERRYRDAALAHWKTNPEVDYLIGRKLSQKYRFAEGAGHQRQALEYDAKYLPARIQLAQDLLRLGQEDEGWKLADEVYKVDGYNVFAHNLVMLQETVARFRTLDSGGISLRMDAREAEIYGQRVLNLLDRARQTLCAKYQVTLTSPIVVEMFPRQQDFAIRTFGLPGGDGFLGVCFGTVITANSPASQADHPTCWEATLWHEFCHVVTLNKTKNRMPRWLSEGISVYEERLADPAWGQSITPRYRKMLLGDDLTPVSRLSGAFLHPATPLHLQFAYFESSLVVEYIVATYGFETLLKILDDLGTGLSINDTLNRHTGSLEALDRGFADYARKIAEGMSPLAEWSEPELPKRIDTSLLAEYSAQHPNNYPVLLRLARQLVAENKWSDARPVLEQMRSLYPADASAEGLYPLLAKVHRELDEPDLERSAWEQLATMSAQNTEMFDRLTELAARAEDWEVVRRFSDRWLAVNPLQPAPYRRAADAAEHLDDGPLAAESYQALLQLDPIDPPELHLRLGRLNFRSGNLDAARRHALLALERTPRFRAAQQLLLQVAEARSQKSTVPAEPPAEKAVEADTSPESSAP